MTDETFNKKLEKDARNSGRSNPVYPWFRGEMDINGRKIIINANPDFPNESYEEKFNHDASFEITEASGLKNILNMHVRSYTSKGHSQSTDGNAAEYGKSNKNSSYDSDIGQTAGGSHFRGSGKGEHSGTGEGSVHNDSDGNSYKISNGDHITTYAGHISENYEKDRVLGVNGNDITIVGGEYGVNVQGNASIQSIAAGLHMYGQANVVANSPGPILIESKTQGVEIKGQANVHIDSQGAVLIESPVSITLKVGSSSIVITPSSITVIANGKSGAINLN